MSNRLTSEHTPGPWRVQPVGNADFRRPNEDGAKDLCIVAENGICPGIVWEFMKEGEANARLIAAAPDLLALAKQYASECSSCDGTGEVGWSEEEASPCPDCEDIRSVIKPRSYERS